jgi:hypothetical protein
MKIKIGLIGSIVMLGLGVQSSAMQFSDHFDGYAVGDLTAATTNWVPGVWDAHFDVIDDGGDQKAQHNGVNNHTLVVVNPDNFTLEAGQDLAITNVFSSGSSGWARGVFFNYTRTDVIDAYIAYITPVSGQLGVKIDKWENSSNLGSGITNILSATNLGSSSLMAGDGVMVVTYDADTQTIGIDVSIDNDFYFSTNLVDRSFTGGQVGLYGKSASGYTIEAFAVNGFQDPVEPRYVSRLFVDDFDTYADGDLAAVSTNWAAGIWDSDFDVVDDDGDKVAQLARANRVSLVTVDASAFAVASGENFVMTSRFTSTSDNWHHGVAFNYERTTNNAVNMYALSLTRSGASNQEIFVNLDKWDNANNTGTIGVTNLFSIGTGAGNYGDLNTNGVMVVSYDSATAEISVQIEFETGFWFANKIVDTSFDSGQVGLYGKLSGEYVISEFSAAIYSQLFPPPVIGIEAVSADLFKLVIDMNESTELDGYSPVVRDALTGGSWVAVAHSDDGIHSFVQTNLTYSTTDGSNRVIYVQSGSSKGFFGLQ